MLSHVKKVAGWQLVLSFLMTSEVVEMADVPARPARKKRIRLSSATRKELILDAALIEFGEHGFGGASTEKIARRAGLSQAGLYTHFKGKEDILESLLREVLTFRQQEGTSWPTSGPAAVDTLLDEIYTVIAKPRVLALMRILIMEGPRVRHVIRRWRGNVMHPEIGEKRELIGKLVDEGVICRSPMTEIDPFFWSPVTHALVLQLTLGEELSRDGILALREAHRQMLCGPCQVPGGRPPGGFAQTPENADPQSGLRWRAARKTYSA